MFGQYDGLAIFELPDAQTAAALSLTVTGSGAFSGSRRGRPMTSTLVTERHQSRSV
jgi:uncharacterized protein with GYD domain